MAIHKIQHWHSFAFITLIEGIGTFFTYERTPQQSIFSLEELFRHEFTHYLQGRYEVPRLWVTTHLDLLR
nr:collagenase [Bacillus pseudomycoides]